jgi:RNA polymerase sigma factor (TIGR02999 family)
MNLTDLINRRDAVDKAELEALASALWPMLERLAARQLQGRSGLTLQASDLAQDAYIALMHEFPGRFNNREHFYALAARIVRNIVVDYLRRRGADKRGGGLPFERLDRVEHEVAGPLDDTVDWIAVDAALTVLAERHEAAAKVVELKFFAGLTNEQIAEAMHLSRATVIRHYRYARAWLIDHFDAGAGAGAGTEPLADA